VESLMSVPHLPLLTNLATTIAAAIAQKSMQRPFFSQSP
jgi:hypothetical protein